MGKQPEYEKNLVFSTFCHLIACSFTSITLFLFNTIFNAQKTPFIDEVFHIPQAQKFCNGSFFEWDQKITTLPGLYLLSVGVLSPLSKLADTDLCSVYGLRAINFVVCVINFYLFYVLCNILQKNESNKDEVKWKYLVTALNLSIFPVLYFFTFLYYTDSLSTCLVLLSYVLHLQNKNYLSALIGFISVLVRQTNIVWLFLFAVDLVVEVLKAEAMKNRKKKLASDDETKFKYFEVLLSTVAETSKRGSYHISHLIGRIVGHTFPFTLLGLSFILFYIFNGGVVIGDRSAHTPVLNIPQLFYFAFFSTMLSLPLAVTHVKEFIHSVSSNKQYVFILFVISVIVVYECTHVHPYLLADNRHYTFYIWKRLYSNMLFKYLVIPVYLFGLFYIKSAIQHSHITFKIFFWFCVVLSIVPQKLLEFRYFIIPYILFRLQIQSATWFQLILEGVIYFFINAFTIYLFVIKTFYWVDSQEPQRIIW
uniref:Dol-P-Glc:Glc(2)Man(9)GlcNAc(2)-PP-Dol alpha-1,2-glucosyltransferase n=1 Tax=Clastoptera arizonana TaxID=38151 RepID=A0A1B6CLY3_9HEMI